MGAIVLSLLIGFGVIYSRKQSRQIQKLNHLPKVCEIWNRWRYLKKDYDASSFKIKLGDNWSNNVCPKNSLFQTYNGSSAICIHPKNQEEVVSLLCTKAISNDDLATPVPALCKPEEPCSSYDHWVFLTEDVEISKGEKHGSAWQNDICPSGAALQRIENETWCVLPKEISTTLV